VIVWFLTFFPLKNFLFTVVQNLSLSSSSYDNRRRIIFNAAPLSKKNAVGGESGSKIKMVRLCCTLK
jgi:hypothetical protein